MDLHRLPTETDFNNEVKFHVYHMVTYNNPNILIKVLLMEIVCI